MSKNKPLMTYAEWGRCSGTSAPSLGMILMLYPKRLSGGVSRKAEVDPDLGASCTRILYPLSPSENLVPILYPDPKRQKPHKELIL
jgi:hypothetical protein